MTTLLTLDWPLHTGRKYWQQQEPPRFIDFPWRPGRTWWPVGTIASGWRELPDVYTSKYHCAQREIASVVAICQHDLHDICRRCSISSLTSTEVSAPWSGLQGVRSEVEDLACTPMSDGSSGQSDRPQMPSMYHFLSPPLLLTLTRSTSFSTSTWQWFPIDLR